MVDFLGLRLGQPNSKVLLPVSALFAQETVTIETKEAHLRLSGGGSGHRHCPCRKRTEITLSLKER